MGMHHETEKEQIELEGEKLKNAYKRILMGPEEGFKGYFMRVFELKSGGYTSEHKHPWPHINYVVSGRGIIRIDGKDNIADAGTYGFISPNALHQFVNDGVEPFKFICIVTEEGEMNYIASSKDK